MKKTISFWEYFVKSNPRRHRSFCLGSSIWKVHKTWTDEAIEFRNGENNRITFYKHGVFICEIEDVCIVDDDTIGDFNVSIDYVISQVQLILQKEMEIRRKEVREYNHIIFGRNT